MKVMRCKQEKEMSLLLDFLLLFKINMWGAGEMFFLFCTKNKFITTTLF